MTGSEKLRALEEQNEALIKERDEANVAKGKVELELAEANKAKAEAETAKAKVEAELAEANKAKTELADKVTKLEGEAKTAEQRAQEIAAGFGGVAGKKAADADKQASGGDVVEQLFAIKDPTARAEFFKANEKQIHAANAALKAKA